MKKISLVLMIIVFLTLIGVSCNNSNGNGGTVNNDQNNQTGSEPQVAGDSTASAEYFSNDAKVMMFYSDYCGWCTKEKEVLKELAPDGYKVKPMNVGTDQSLWQTYSIEGTPTFIAPDGTKLVGYQDKDKLKAFLDKYK